ncbi:hypothetical protein F4779DRAFT_83034 [Xylariaceae sp. FL0662B]|nr:hypothetical protein F4779DRAFT_83034 [Xylariaceae sp. FL0662B]
MDPVTAHTYILGGASSGYADQSSWPASTAMTRGPSHESGSSEYTDYSASTSGSGQGQYETAFSPSSDATGSYAYFGVADTVNYVTGGQGYNAYNQGEEDPGFQYQYYDFIPYGEGGQGPYWRLKAGYAPSAALPARIAYEQNIDVPRSAAAADNSNGNNNKKNNNNSDTSGQHVCLEPFCDARPFRRKADLQRHYAHMHRAASQKPAFPCDWKRCQRHREPFFRLDHCREHYRDYHSEDLLRRGGQGPRRDESPDWWRRRNVDPRWWRCPKCLARIHVDADGFDCARCGVQCEPERRRLRGYD